MACVFNNADLTREACDELLLAALIEFGFDDDYKLEDLQKEYFRHIRLFYNIQRWYEIEGLKNFALMPIFKHGRHHIRYDSSSLHSTIRSLKLFSGDWGEFPVDVHWRRYFRIDQIETARRKFGDSIDTDGVAISFTMAREKKKWKHPNDVKAENDIQRDRFNAAVATKIGNNGYTQELGLDTGRRLMIGGVRRGTEPNAETTLIKLKANTYRRLTGELKRKRVRNNFCKEIDREFNEAAKLVSPNSINHLAYTTMRLKYFTRKQEIYAQRKVARMKFKKFMLVDSVMENWPRSSSVTRKPLFTSDQRIRQEIALFAAMFGHRYHCYKGNYKRSQTSTLYR